MDGKLTGITSPFLGGKWGKRLKQIKITFEEVPGKTSKKEDCKWWVSYHPTYSKRNWLLIQIYISHRSGMQTCQRVDFF